MKNLSRCLVAFCFLYNTFQMTNADVVGERSGTTRNTRGARKLFGGYRITPKFCKATRTPVNPPGGPNICMFNHECSMRSGEVVGACMDGFLFGACCQLPPDSLIGDLLSPDYPGVMSMDKMSSKIIPTTHRTTPTYLDITSNGVSQIAASLLGGNPPFSGGAANVLPTGNDNTIQVQSGDNKWTTTGIMYTGADTDIDEKDNEISGYFSSTKGSSEPTTSRYADTYPPPILHISVSNAPVGYTPLPTIQRPMFRPKPPKPTDEVYVLVPTLTAKPNKTEDLDTKSSASTTNKPLSTFSFVSSSFSTTRKPPSTSYIASSTIPSRRTSTTPTTTTRTRKPTKKTTTKYSPTTIKYSSTTTKYAPTTSKPPSTSYVYSTTKPRPRPNSPSTNNVYTTTEDRPVHSSTVRPNTVAHSTFANSPEAFPGTFSTPSYSYVSGSSTSDYRPATVSSSIAGPGFTVTSQPVNQYSPFPNPAPTLIVLGPVSQDSSDSVIVSAPAATEPSKYERPALSQLPQKKPVNVVTINNHVTQNLYSTPRPQTSSSSSSTQNLPSPTVIITPKPTISSSYAPLSDEDLEGVVVTSINDLNNFPPDRNPNLNLSIPIFTDDDITTPSFVEDEGMNEKVESFVNQIIYGLQEPFNDLKDIVYNKEFNATEGPTKKPVKKQGSTTKKPNTVKTTTRRPVTTKKPTQPVRVQSTSSKRPAVTTGRPVTTVQNFIDTETEPQQSYRDQCGARPLLRAGRIVGGRGAIFGEFPWQVLVRESTWLGLFTKNKCGGVLISDKYVITAAHCQPGFLASLVAVFGEYDISGDLESRKPISRNVKRVIVHRKYDPATFENDLALLELESTVKFDAHIIPICLPPDNSDYTKRMATVTGWGRLKYGGGVPSVLQEVQVPIMENHVCQEMFRTAGHSKVILESFLCAGYANGQKDACEGDSGGPLVVQRPDGRYELAGTVSHGIKCAAPYLPGVYMRTTYYKPWITSITGLE